MRLIDAQEIIIKKYPQFSQSQFAENNKGWSNYVVVVDDQYIFRFPRNNTSYKMLEVEKGILSQFKKLSNIKVPNFEYIHNNSEHSFVGYELIEGKELSPEILDSLNDLDYGNVAKSIGRFLELLHSYEFDPSLPLTNHHASWRGLKERVLTEAYEYFTSEERNWLQGFFDSFYEQYDCRKTGLSLVHGDFTWDHILIGDDNRLSGIIDFGDVCIGDPAFDFAGLYASYGKRFMALVRSNYNLEMDLEYIQRIEEFYMKQVHFHGLLFGIASGDKERIESSMSKIRSVIT